jgi:hypothetical protein
MTTIASAGALRVPASNVPGIIGVKVDRLRADHDHRVQMGLEGSERVEQRGACGGEQVSVARPAHWLPSSPAALVPRWGHVQGR